MRERIRLIVGLAAAAAALAACTGHGTSAANDTTLRRATSPSIPQSTPIAIQRGPHYPLTLQIRLSRTTVPAGHPIHGLATITNRNPQRLVIGTCNHVWLQVGIANASVPFEPAWNLCADLGGTAVQPGTTKLPITIQTTYEKCTPHASSATAQAPACVHGHMPPLPPGTYSTKPVALSPEGVRVTTSHPIKVTLTE